MINSIEVQNYRCFSSLSLSGLKRINFIVGQNGSGKTALLETLFLASGGSPQLYFTIRAMRGQRPVALAPIRASYEAQFKGLFHQFDLQRVVSVRFTDTESGPRSLQIGFAQMGQQSITIPLENEPGNAYEPTVITPITFRWSSPLGEHESTVELGDGELKVMQSNDVYPGVFVTAVTLSLGRDNAERFSRLSKKRRINVILNAIQKSFPQVEDLSIETDAADSVIYAGVKNLSEKIPIGSLSSGIAKSLSILLAVGDTPKGFVLVDEIENGLYYEKFDSLMKSILDLCDTNQTQLFASTHSREFLMAMEPFIEEHPGLFSLIRMRQVNGSCTATLFGGKDLRAALDQDRDVR